MNAYLLVKMVHVLSATVLFGTGLGTAYFMLRAYLSRDATAMRHVAHSVVLADWIFTTPAVIVQLVSGLWLVTRIGIPLDSVWFVSVIALFVFVGACWLPVVCIQIRVRDMALADVDPRDYGKLMRIWIVLGVAAFSAVLFLFYLMVTKVGIAS